jgi:hypothetical protein
MDGKYGVCFIFRHRKSYAFQSACYRQMFIVSVPHMLTVYNFQDNFIYLFLFHHLIADDFIF